MYVCMYVYFVTMYVCMYVGLHVCLRQIGTFLLPIFVLGIDIMNKLDRNNMYGSFFIIVPITYANEYASPSSLKKIFYLYEIKYSHSAISILSKIA